MAIKGKSESRKQNKRVPTSTPNNGPRDTQAILRPTRAHVKHKPAITTTVRPRKYGQQRQYLLLIE